MDIAPKTLREVEFREKFRGYHPEDVDTFLERVAVGVEALQNQLRQASERAVHAETLATQAGSSDEELSRTLVLAQRTADTAITEAKEQAARVVAAAETQAGIILEEAGQRAKRAAEEAQAALRADLASLEQARVRLKADVEALQAWLDDHRGALAGTLADLGRQLREGLELRSEPPPLSDVEIPAEPDVPEAVVEAAEGGASLVERSGREARAAHGSPIAPPEPAAEAEPEPEPEAEEEAVEEAPPAEAVVAPSESPVPADADADGEADSADATGGEDGEEEYDPFMAELRRAVHDTEPLGPRDDGPPGPVTPPAPPDPSPTPPPEAEEGKKPRLRRRR